MPTRFPKEGNPYWPLPINYPALNREGQRLARLNALMLQDTPEDLVAAWSFFREYYLKPADTGWYKKIKVSPPMHYKIPWDMGKYSMNAWAAPRSFAKTTVVREMALLLLLTRKFFLTSLIQATERKSKKSMFALKRQFEFNRYINDDFSPLYGSLKPKRGDRSWNSEFLELPHGSSIEGLSVNGALRGDRPDLLLVDDPEYDDEEGDNTISQARLIEDFEKLLFKTLLGMLDDGAGIFWIGTLISRKSFLYHVSKGGDPRFKYWNRRVLSVVMPDKSLLWEDKWDEQAVRDKMLRLGVSAFNSEMMNNPGSGTARILTIHPELCTYRVEEGEPHKEERPLDSQATLVYHEGIKAAGAISTNRVQKTFGEWASGLYRLVTVDYAPTQKDTSDYSCVQVHGFDRSNTLWLLDIFLGKVRDDELIQKIWELSTKWRVKQIGVEAISIQKHLADRVAADFARRSEGTNYLPRVVPLRYPGKLSKAERISGLEWRFNQFRIKLPIHRIEEAGVKQLFFQVENFTPDLSLLRWDDAVDTLAMQQYLLKGQGSMKDRAPNLKSPLEILKAGGLVDEETGINVLSGLNASDLPVEVIRKMINKKYEDVDTEEPEADQWFGTRRGPFAVCS